MQMALEQNCYSDSESLPQIKHSPANFLSVGGSSLAGEIWLVQWDEKKHSKSQSSVSNWHQMVSPFIFVSFWWKAHKVLHIAGVYQFVIKTNVHSSEPLLQLIQIIFLLIKVMDDAWWNVSSN